MCVCERERVFENEKGKNELQNHAKIIQQVKDSNISKIASLFDLYGDTYTV